MVVARVYILRHGETDENRAHIIQGQKDTLLNDDGRKQAAMAADVFKDIDLDIAFTSDLQRAAETTDIILRNHPKHDQIRLIKDKSLRERSLGQFEGQHISVKQKFTGLDETAEKVETFVDRALTWWDTQIIAGLQGEERRDSKPHEVLAVSHGGFINNLVRNLVSSGRVKADPVTNWVCLNVSITTLEVEEGSKARLVRYSDVSHLNAEKLVQYNADVVKQLA